MESYSWKACQCFFLVTLVYLCGYQLAWAGGGQPAIKKQSSPSKIWTYLGEGNHSVDTLVSMLEQQARAILVDPPSSSGNLEERLISLEELGFRKLSQYYKSLDREDWMPRDDWEATTYFWDSVNKYTGNSPDNFHQIFPDIFINASPISRSRNTTSTKCYHRLLSMIYSTLQFFKANEIESIIDEVDIARMKTEGFLPKHLLASDIALRYKDDDLFDANDRIIKLWYRILTILWLDASANNLRSNKSYPLVNWRTAVLSDDYDGSGTDDPSSINMALMTYSKQLSDKISKRTKNIEESNRELQRKLAEQEERRERKLAEQKEKRKRKLAEQEEIWERKLTEQEEKWERKLTEQEEKWERKLTEQEEKWERKLTEQEEKWEKKFVAQKESLESYIENKNYILKEIKKLDKQVEAIINKQTEQDKKLITLAKNHEDVLEELEKNENTVKAADNRLDNITLDLNDFKEGTKLLGGDITELVKETEELRKNVGNNESQKIQALEDEIKKKSEQLYDSCEKLNQYRYVAPPPYPSGRNFTTGVHNSMRSAATNNTMGMSFAVAEYPNVSTFSSRMEKAQQKDLPKDTAPCKDKLSRQKYIKHAMKSLYQQPVRFSSPGVVQDSAQPTIFKPYLPLPPSSK